MFSQMLKENGEFSLTRFLAFASFVSFILVTIIIMAVNFYFAYDPGWYSTFATSTVGGTFIQPINKLIKNQNDTYNFNNKIYFGNIVSLSGNW